MKTGIVIDKSSCIAINPRSSIKHVFTELRLLPADHDGLVFCDVLSVIGEGEIVIHLIDCDIKSLGGCGGGAVGDGKFKAVIIRGFIAIVDVAHFACVELLQGKAADGHTGIG